MKALKLSLFASAIVLSSITAATAQSADEVLSKHITAIGGADTWNKITSMKTTSTATMQGMELQLTETKVKGKGMRTDINIMGTNNYTILTPTGGWAYMPAMGSTKAKEIKGEELTSALAQIEITDDVINYKEKGIKAEFVGKEDINSKPAYKLTLTEKDGTVTTTYFDAATYYKVREAQKVTMEGQEVEVVNDYSEFKKLPEGIVVAMKVSNAQGDQDIKSVEVNKPVDDAIFKPAN